ncbi:MAG: monofunctional biosynthetic peptidoglycan transglycosylase, partial [Elusimicrobia bacterium]|nr:monofunctional biosynthetic peptidoglycan transglycosylase [Elusimicrobiota bacterium]
MKKRKTFLKEALLLLLAGLLTGAMVWKGLSPSERCPAISVLKIQNPGTTAFIEFRRREARKKKRRFRPARQWAPLSRISPHLQHAVISAEDDTFYRHKGVEWECMRRALQYNWKMKQKARGGSTITQQLAKNLYLSPAKSLTRKLRELFIALELERELPKRRILELYLNVVEWGDGIFGAEAASRAYFHKAASDLTVEEAAALACTLPSPRRFNPLSPSKWVQRRKDWVYK